MTESSRIALLVVLIAAIVIGVLVALTVHHAIISRRTRAMKRSINADRRHKDTP
jgi:hypothetical protein